MSTRRSSQQKLSINTRAIDTGYCHYLIEVGMMMHSFGDAIPSDNDTVKILEDYVRRATVDLMHTASRNVSKAGRDKVTLFDVLLLYKNNVQKVDYIQQSLGYKLPYIRGLQEKRRGMLDDRIWKFCLRKRDSVYLNGEFDDFIEDNEFEKKKKKIEEDVKEQKDYLGSDMNSRDHALFLKNTRTTFLYVIDQGYLTSSLRKFCSWIGYTSSMNIRFERAALEALGVISYDIVGQVTLLSLMVQKDMYMMLQDKFEVARGITSGVMTVEERGDFTCFPMEKDVNDLKVASSNLAMRKPINTIHVLEAIRRIGLSKKRRKFRLN